jgi:hypothetical protein
MGNKNLKYKLQNAKAKFFESIEFFEFIVFIGLTQETKESLL